MHQIGADKRSAEPAKLRVFDDKRTLGHDDFEVKRMIGRKLKKAQEQAKIQSDHLIQTKCAGLSAVFKIFPFSDNKQI